MNLFLLQQYQFINDIYKNENYLDVLMNIDDFFDILNLYVFPNWFDAEVVEVKFLKHFTNIVLKTPRDKKPDEKGSVLLSKYDCLVKYKETYEYLPKEYKSEKDVKYNTRTGKIEPIMEKKDIWLVDILIPNKHILNDNVYDLDAIQKKIDDDKEVDGTAESLVSTNEEI